jgi:hypothetical protein
MGVSKGGGFLYWRAPPLAGVRLKWMSRTPGLLAAIAVTALVCAPPAGAYPTVVKRVKLAPESTRTWTTNRSFGTSEDVRAEVYVNGKPLHGSSEGGCNVVWAGRGVIVEADGKCDRRAPVVYRMGNVRRKTALVRIVMELLDR